MSVEFDEPTAMTTRSASSRRSKFAELVIKTGLAKDEQGANTVLVVIAVAMIVIALFLFFRSSSGTPDIDPDTYKTVRPS